MKKISIALLTIMAFVSCQEQTGSKNTLKGKIDAVDGTKIYYAALLDQVEPTPIDTVEVKDGAFELELPITDFQNIGILSVEKGRGNVIFINENKNLSAELYKDSLRASKISGSAENEYFSEYMDLMKQSNKKVQELRMKYNQPDMAKDEEAVKVIEEEYNKIQVEDNKKRVELIKEHPKSIISVLILSDLMNSKALPFTQLKELFSSLSKEAQETSLGKQINESLQALSKTAIGTKAPEFSAPNPEGKEIALKDVLGKVTIIDFWASWCRPCRMENPNMVRLYKEYHDKGLNIIGVSLDQANQKDKWIKAIEDDHLTWYQVSNLQSWNGPIARMYDIRSIPATFILDENGIIIDKDLRGKALENKIAELLK